MTAADYAAYDNFLFRVNWLEQHAATLSASGQNASAQYAQSLVRTQAGLTSAEEGVLKSISAVWVRIDSTFLDSARQAATSAGADPAGAAQKQQDLRARRQQDLVAQITQLLAAFGPERFTALDAYIHVKSKPPAGVALPSTPPASAKPKEVPR